MRITAGTPKVSVCVVTYNQEKYIGECLQSLVDQDVDFAFEVIVGDDCSTDGTRAIVQAYADRYPHLVKPVLHEKNTGPTRNYLSVHDIARGEYVAHMDGDDLALPGKLRQQADYLDAHADCSAVWHRMNIFNDARSWCIPNLPDTDMFEDGRVSLADLLRFGTVGYHSSMMYRASARPPRTFAGEVLDYLYSVELLMSGYGKYLDSVLGAYRLNADTGISRKGNGALAVRRLYAAHLEQCLTRFPDGRSGIFFNSTINFLYDLKAGRPTARLFFRLALRSFTVVNPVSFVAHARKFRKINPNLFPQGRT